MFACLKQIVRKSYVWDDCDLSRLHGIRDLPTVIEIWICLNRGEKFRCIYISLVWRKSGFYVEIDLSSLINCSLLQCGRGTNWNETGWWLTRLSYWFNSITSHYLVKSRFCEVRLMSQQSYYSLHDIYILALKSEGTYLPGIASVYVGSWLVAAKNLDIRAKLRS